MKLKWIFLLLFMCVSAFAGEKKYLTVSIDGISCPYCISVLVKNIGALTGVEEVRVSSDYQRLLIVMKPNTEPNLSQINNTIKSSGYLATNTMEITGKTSQNQNAPAIKGRHIDIKNQPCGNCHHK